VKDNEPIDGLPQVAMDRRDMLTRCGMGLGGLALGQLLAEDARGESNPLLPRGAQFPAKAKRVIHLFCNGGPSQVDTFDPKPLLQQYAGKTIPGGNLKTERPTGAALPSPFRFRQYGESGTPVSELFPHVAESIDDIAVIRSMHANVPNHEPSLLLMNCGEARLVRPSLGSWLTYGLGTDNQNLPAFVSMCPGGYPIQESQNWQAGFLPGIFQGTYIDTKKTALNELIENVRNDRIPRRQTLRACDGSHQRKQVARQASRHRRQDAKRRCRADGRSRGAGRVLPTLHVWQPPTWICRCWTGRGGRECAPCLGALSCPALRCWIPV